MIYKLACKTRQCLRFLRHFVKIILSHDAADLPANRRKTACFGHPAQNRVCRSRPVPCQGFRKISFCHPVRRLAPQPAPLRPRRKGASAERPRECPDAEAHALLGAVRLEWRWCGVGLRLPRRFAGDFRGVASQMIIKHSGSAISVNVRLRLLVTGHPPKLLIAPYQFPHNEHSSYLPIRFKLVCNTKLQTRFCHETTAI